MLATFIHYALRIKYYSTTTTKSLQSCDSVRPHRRQLSRLRRPWDSLGKNTGVGCHFLLQCMKVKSESEVAQSHRTLSDPMDCSPPDSSIYGIFQEEYWSGVPLPFPKLGHDLLLNLILQVLCPVLKSAKWNVQ